MKRKSTVAENRFTRTVKLLREQPRGLYLVSITELWERFSYWGMLGLLVLFLTASPTTGGFGWTSAEALGLYALYTGAVFSAPAFGGYLASRYFGERLCILWGGVCVTAGHFLLAGPAFIPWLVEQSTHYPVGESLAQCGIVLGQILPDAETRAALESGRCGVAAAQSAIKFTYLFQAWTFMGGLVLIVLGTGFIKSTVSSIVGKLYETSDRRREEGYGIFMAFIYIGAMSANFVAGTLGERVGWHFGFGVAGLGMAAGVAWYALRHRAVLGDIGMKPDHSVTTHAAPQLTRVEWQRIAVAFVMSAFVVIYAMTFYQKGGMLNLEAKTHVDRHVFGFEVPVTWLLNISTLVFILLTLPAARLWRSLAAKNREPDVVLKLSGGLIALAIGYGFLMLGLSEKALAENQQFSLWWMVALYACFGLGDLLVWPTQISAVNRLAPARYAAFAVGSWYLTIGFGSWLTGYFGKLGSEVGIMKVALLLITICITSAIVLYFLRSRLRRMMHGAL
jgi:proton-dependent oligopeptide transporter, POT family